VKIAFVAGFFDPVKKEIEKNYSAHQANGSVIWVRQIGMNREVNLSEFAARFNDAAKRADSILILLALLTGREWVMHRVRDIIEKAKKQNRNLDCELATFRNAGDRSGVLDRLRDFDLQSPALISAEKIRSKIPEGKVLCVSLEGKTRILDALERSGFSLDSIDICFHEERVEGARNSNLMETLTSRSSNFRYLLYAWDGLRTLKPEVGRKFEKCYEAPNASKVVRLFKSWITDGG